MHSNFDELLQNYLEVSSGPVEDPADRLGEFSDSLRSFTCLSSFRELSALTYGDQSPSSCSIVSSIEFDKDGEFFAIAGVTRKIKVCSQTSLWFLRSEDTASFLPPGIQLPQCAAQCGLPEPLPCAGDDMQCQTEVPMPPMCGLQCVLLVCVPLPQLCVLQPLPQVDTGFQRL